MPKSGPSNRLPNQATDTPEQLWARRLVLLRSELSGSILLTRSLGRLLCLAECAGHCALWKPGNQGTIAKICCSTEHEHYSWLGSNSRLLLPVRFGRVSKMLRRWGVLGGSRYTIVIHWQDCAQIAPKSCPASLADGSAPVKKLLLQRAAAQKPHDVFHGFVASLQGPIAPGPGPDSDSAKENFSQSLSSAGCVSTSLVVRDQRPHLRG